MSVRTALHPTGDFSDPRPMTCTGDLSLTHTQVIVNGVTQVTETVRCARSMAGSIVVAGFDRASSDSLPMILGRDYSGITKHSQRRYSLVTRLSCTAYTLMLEQRNAGNRRLCWWSIMKWQHGVSAQLQPAAKHFKRSN